MPTGIELHWRFSESSVRLNISLTAVHGLVSVRGGGALVLPQPWQPSRQVSIVADAQEVAQALDYVWWTSLPEFCRAGGRLQILMQGLHSQEVQARRLVSLEPAPIPAQLRGPATLRTKEDMALPLSMLELASTSPGRQYHLVMRARFGLLRSHTEEAASFELKGTGDELRLHLDSLEYVPLRNWNSDRHGLDEINGSVWEGSWDFSVSYSFHVFVEPVQDAAEILGSFPDTFPANQALQLSLLHIASADSTHLQLKLMLEARNSTLMCAPSVPSGLQVSSAPSELDPSRSTLRAEAAGRFQTVHVAGPFLALNAFLDSCTLSADSESPQMAALEMWVLPANGTGEGPNGSSTQADSRRTFTVLFTPVRHPPTVQLMRLVPMSDSPEEKQVVLTFSARVDDEDCAMGAGDLSKGEPLEWVTLFLEARYGTFSSKTGSHWVSQQQVPGKLQLHGPLPSLNSVASEIVYIADKKTGAFDTITATAFQSSEYQVLGHSGKATASLSVSLGLLPAGINLSMASSTALEVNEDDMLRLPLSVETTVSGTVQVGVVLNNCSVLVAAVPSAQLRTPASQASPQALAGVGNYTMLGDGIPIHMEVSDLHMAFADTWLVCPPNWYGVVNMKFHIDHVEHGYTELVSSVTVHPVRDDPQVFLSVTPRSQEELSEADASLKILFDSSFDPASEGRVLVSLHAVHFKLCIRLPHDVQVHTVLTTMQSDDGTRWCASPEPGLSLTVPRAWFATNELQVRAVPVGAQAGTQRLLVSVVELGQYGSGEQKTVYASAQLPASSKQLQLKVAWMPTPQGGPLWLPVDQPSPLPKLSWSLPPGADPWTLVMNGTVLLDVLNASTSARFGDGVSAAMVTHSSPTSVSFEGHLPTVDEWLRSLSILASGLAPTICGAGKPPPTMGSLRVVADARRPPSSGHFGRVNASIALVLCRHLDPPSFVLSQPHIALQAREGRSLPLPSLEVVGDVDQQASASVSTVSTCDTVRLPALASDLARISSQSSMRTSFECAWGTLPSVFTGWHFLPTQHGRASAARNCTISVRAVVPSTSTMPQTASLLINVIVSPSPRILQVHLAHAPGQGERAVPSATGTTRVLPQVEGAFGDVISLSFNASEPCSIAVRSSGEFRRHITFSGMQDEVLNVLAEGLAIRSPQACILQMHVQDGSRNASTSLMLEPFQERKPTFGFECQHCMHRREFVPSGTSEFRLADALPEISGGTGIAATLLVLAEDEHSVDVVAADATVRVRQETWSGKRYICLGGYPSDIQLLLSSIVLKSPVVASGVAGLVASRSRVEGRVRPTTASKWTETCDALQKDSSQEKTRTRFSTALYWPPRLVLPKVYTHCTQSQPIPVRYSERVPLSSCFSFETFTVAPSASQVRIQLIVDSAVGLQVDASALAKVAGILGVAGLAPIDQIRTLGSNSWMMLANNTSSGHVRFRVCLSAAVDGLPLAHCSRQLEMHAAAEQIAPNSSIALVPPILVMDEDGSGLVCATSDQNAVRLVQGPTQVDAVVVRPASDCRGSDALHLEHGCACIVPEPNAFGAAPINISYTSKGKRSSAVVRVIVRPLADRPRMEWGCESLSATAGQHSRLCDLQVNDPDSIAHFGDAPFAPSLFSLSLMSSGKEGRFHVRARVAALLDLGEAAGSVTLHGTAQEISASVDFLEFEAYGWACGQKPTQPELSAMLSGDGGQVELSSTLPIVLHGTCTLQEFAVILHPDVNQSEEEPWPLSEMVGLVGPPGTNSRQRVHVHVSCASCLRWTLGRVQSEPCVWYQLGQSEVSFSCDWHAVYGALAQLRVSRSPASSSLATAEDLLVHFSAENYANKSIALRIPHSEAAIPSISLHPSEAPGVVEIALHWPATLRSCPWQLEVVAGLGPPCESGTAHIHTNVSRQYAGIYRHAQHPRGNVSLALKGTDAVSDWSKNHSFYISSHSPCGCEAWLSATLVASHGEGHGQVVFRPDCTLSQGAWEVSVRNTTCDKLGSGCQEVQGAPHLLCVGDAIQPGCILRHSTWEFSDQDIFSLSASAGCWAQTEQGAFSEPNAPRGHTCTRIIHLPFGGYDVQSSLKSLTLIPSLDVGLKQHTPIVMELASSKGVVASATLQLSKQQALPTLAWLAADGAAFERMPHMQKVKQEVNAPAAVQTSPPAHLVNLGQATWEAPGETILSDFVDIQRGPDVSLEEMYKLSISSSAVVSSHPSQAVPQHHMEISGTVAQLTQSMSTIRLAVGSQPGSGQPQGGTVHLNISSMDKQGSLATKRYAFSVVFRHSQSAAADVQFLHSSQTSHARSKALSEVLRINPASEREKARVISVLVASTGGHLRVRGDVSGVVRTEYKGDTSRVLLQGSQPLVLSSLERIVIEANDPRASLVPVQLLAALCSDCRASDADVQLPLSKLESKLQRTKLSNWIVRETVVIVHSSSIAVTQVATAAPNASTAAAQVCRGVWSRLPPNLFSLRKQPQGPPETWVFQVNVSDGFIERDPSVLSNSFDEQSSPSSLLLVLSGAQVEHALASLRLLVQSEEVTVYVQAGKVEHPQSIAQGKPAGVHAFSGLPAAASIATTACNHLSPTLLWRDPPSTPEGTVVHAPLQLIHEPHATEGFVNVTVHTAGGALSVRDAGQRVGSSGNGTGALQLAGSTGDVASALKSLHFMPLPSLSGSILVLAKAQGVDSPVASTLVHVRPLNSAPRWWIPEEVIQSAESWMGVLHADEEFAVPREELGIPSGLSKSGLSDAHPPSPSFVSLQVPPSQGFVAIRGLRLSDADCIESDDCMIQIAMRTSHGRLCIAGQWEKGLAKNVRGEAQLVHNLNVTQTVSGHGNVHEERDLCGEGISFSAGLRTISTLLSSSSDELCVDCGLTLHPTLSAPAEVRVTIKATDATFPPISAAVTSILVQVQPVQPSVKVVTHPLGMHDLRDAAFSSQSNYILLDDASAGGGIPLPSLQLLHKELAVPRVLVFVACGGCSALNLAGDLPSHWIRSTKAVAALTTLGDAQRTLSQRVPLHHSGIVSRPMSVFVVGALRCQLPGESGLCSGSEQVLQDAADSAEAFAANKLEMLERVGDQENTEKYVFLADAEWSLASTWVHRSASRNEPVGLRCRGHERVLSNESVSINCELINAAYQHGKQLNRLQLVVRAVQAGIALNPEVPTHHCFGTGLFGQGLAAIPHMGTIQRNQGDWLRGRRSQLFSSVSCTGSAAELSRLLDIGDALLIVPVEADTKLDLVLSLKDYREGVLDVVKLASRVELIPRLFASKVVHEVVAINDSCVAFPIKLDGVGLGELEVHTSLIADGGMFQFVSSDHEVGLDRCKIEGAFDRLELSAPAPQVRACLAAVQLLSSCPHTVSLQLSLRSASSAWNGTFRHTFTPTLERLVFGVAGKAAEALEVFLKPSLLAGPSLRPFENTTIDLRPLCSATHPEALAELSVAVSAGTLVVSSQTGAGLVQHSPKPSQLPFAVGPTSPPLHLIGNLHQLVLALSTAELHLEAQPGVVELQLVAWLQGSPANATLTARLPVEVASRPLTLRISSCRTQPTEALAVTAENGRKVRFGTCARFHRTATGHFSTDIGLILPETLSEAVGELDIYTTSCFLVGGNCSLAQFRMAQPVHALVDVEGGPELRLRGSSKQVKDALESAVWTPPPWSTGKVTMQAQWSLAPGSVVDIEVRVLPQCRKLSAAWGPSSAHAESSNVGGELVNLPKLFLSFEGSSSVQNFLVVVEVAAGALQFRHQPGAILLPSQSKRFSGHSISTTGSDELYTLMSIRVQSESPNTTVQGIHFLPLSAIGPQRVNVSARLDPELETCSDRGQEIVKLSRLVEIPKADRHFAALRVISGASAGQGQSVSLGSAVQLTCAGPCDMHKELEILLLVSHLELRLDTSSSLGILLELLPIGTAPQSLAEYLSDDLHSHVTHATAQLISMRGTFRNLSLAVEAGLLHPQPAWSGESHHVVGVLRRPGARTSFTEVFPFSIMHRRAPVTAWLDSPIGQDTAQIGEHVRAGHEEWLAGWNDAPCTAARVENHTIKAAAGSSIPLGELANITLSASSPSAGVRQQAIAQVQIMHQARAEIQLVRMELAAQPLAFRLGVRSTVDANLGETPVNCHGQAMLRFQSSVDAQDIINTSIYINGSLGYPGGAHSRPQSSGGKVSVSGSIQSALRTKEDHVEVQVTPEPSMNRVSGNGWSRVMEIRIFHLRQVWVPFVHSSSVICRADVVDYVGSVELSELSLPKPLAGHFALRFAGMTSPLIPALAPPETVQWALEAISPKIAVKVSIERGSRGGLLGAMPTYAVTFLSPLGPLPLLTVDTRELDGPEAGVAVRRLQAGFGKASVRKLTSEGKARDMIMEILIYGLAPAFVLPSEAPLGGHFKLCADFAASGGGFVASLPIDVTAPARVIDESNEQDGGYSVEAKLQHWLEQVGHATPAGPYQEQLKKARVHVASSAIEPNSSIAAICELRNLTLRTPTPCTGGRKLVVTFPTAPVWFTPPAVCGVQIHGAGAGLEARVLDTPPAMRGTFGLSLGPARVDGIPINATAKELTNALTGLWSAANHGPASGSVMVSRTPLPTLQGGFTWTVAVMRQLLAPDGIVLQLHSSGLDARGHAGSIAWQSEPSTAYGATIVSAPGTPRVEQISTASKLGIISSPSLQLRGEVSAVEAALRELKVRTAEHWSGELSVRVAARSAPQGLQGAHVFESIPCDEDGRSTMKPSCLWFHAVVGPRGAPVRVHTTSGFALQAVEDTPVQIEGLRVADEESDLSITTVEVAVEHGLLSFRPTLQWSNPSAASTRTSLHEAMPALQARISGTLSYINEALSTLEYFPEQDFFGMDVLTLTAARFGGAGCSSPLSRASTAPTGVRLPSMEGETDFRNASSLATAELSIYVVPVADPLSLEVPSQFAVVEGEETRVPGVTIRDPDTTHTDSLQSKLHVYLMAYQGGIRVINEGGVGVHQEGPFGDSQDSMELGSAEIGVSADVVGPGESRFFRMIELIGSIERVNAALHSLLFVGRRQARGVATIYVAARRAGQSQGESRHMPIAPARLIRITVKAGKTPIVLSVPSAQLAMLEDTTARIPGIQASVPGVSEAHLQADQATLARMQAGVGDFPGITPETLHMISQESVAGGSSVLNITVLAAGGSVSLPASSAARLLLGTWENSSIICFEAPAEHASEVLQRLTYSPMPNFNELNQGSSGAGVVVGAEQGRIPHWILLCGEGSPWLDTSASVDDCISRVLEHSGGLVLQQIILSGQPPALTACPDDLKLCSRLMGTATLHPEANPGTGVFRLMRLRVIPVNDPPVLLWKQHSRPALRPGVRQAVLVREGQEVGIGGARILDVDAHEALHLSAPAWKAHTAGLGSLRLRVSCVHGLLQLVPAAGSNVRDGDRRDAAQHSNDGGRSLEFWGSPSELSELWARVSYTSDGHFNGVDVVEASVSDLGGTGLPAPWASFNATDLPEELAHPSIARLLNMNVVWPRQSRTAPLHAVSEAALRACAEALEQAAAQLTPPRSLPDFDRLPREVVQQAYALIPPSRSLEAGQRSELVWLLAWTLHTIPANHAEELSKAFRDTNLTHQVALVGYLAAAYSQAPSIPLKTTEHVELQVLPVNDPPSLSLVQTQATMLEDTVFVLQGGLTIADPDIAESGMFCKSDIPEVAQLGCRTPTLSVNVSAVNGGIYLHGFDVERPHVAFSASRVRVPGNMFGVADRKSGPWLSSIHISGDAGSIRSALQQSIEFAPYAHFNSAGGEEGSVAFEVSDVGPSGIPAEWATNVAQAELQVRVMPENDPPIIELDGLARESVNGRAKPPDGQWSGVRGLEDQPLHIRLQVKDMDAVHHEDTYIRVTLSGSGLSFVLPHVEGLLCRDLARDFSSLHEEMTKAHTWAITVQHDPTLAAGVLWLNTSLSEKIGIAYTQGHITGQREARSFAVNDVGSFSVVRSLGTSVQDSAGSPVRSPSLELSGSLKHVNAALDTLVVLPEPDFAGETAILVGATDDGTADASRLLWQHPDLSRVDEHGRSWPLGPKSDFLLIPVGFEEVNDAPTWHIAQGSVVATEGEPLSIAGVEVRDTDGDAADTITVKITVRYGSIAVKPSAVGLLGSHFHGSVVSFRGPLSYVNEALSGLQYVPPDHLNSWSLRDTDLIEFLASDVAADLAQSVPALTGASSASIQVAYIKARNNAPTWSMDGVMEASRECDHLQAPYMTAHCKGRAQRQQLTVREDTLAQFPRLRLDDQHDSGSSPRVFTVTISAKSGELSARFLEGLTLTRGKAAGARILTVQGPLPAINSMLATLSYVGCEHCTGEDEVLFTVDDAELHDPTDITSAEMLVSVFIVPDNDPPTWSGIERAIALAAEEDMSALLLPPILLDADSREGAPVSASVTCDASVGKLAVPAATSSSVLVECRSACVSKPAGGSLLGGNLHLVGRLPELNEALRDLVFVPDDNFNSAILGIAQVSCTATDPASSGEATQQGDTIAFFIDIAEVQDPLEIRFPPHLSTAVVPAQAALTIKEDTVYNLRGATLVDADRPSTDSTDVYELRVSAEHGFVSVIGHSALAPHDSDSDDDGHVRTTTVSSPPAGQASASGSIEGLKEVSQLAGLDGRDRVITLQGHLSMLNLAVGGVQYSPAPDMTGSDTLRISCFRIDPLPEAHLSTASASVEILVLAVNDAPVVHLAEGALGSSALTLLEGSSATFPTMPVNASRLGAIDDWNMHPTPIERAGLWSSTGLAPPHLAGSTANSESWRLAPVTSTAKGQKFSEPTSLTAMERVLFFGAEGVLDSSPIGRELWRYSVAGEEASLVADLLPGPRGSNPSSLVSFNNMLLFSAAGIDTSWMMTRDSCSGFRQSTTVTSRVWQAEQASQTSTRRLDRGRATRHAQAWGSGVRDVRFAVSKATVWLPERVYDCPSGYEWASTVQGQALFPGPADGATRPLTAESGVFSASRYNDPLFPGRALTYASQCGWQGSVFAGENRTMFRFSDSHRTGAFKSSTSTDEGSVQLGDYSLEGFAGVVCVELSAAREEGHCSESPLGCPSQTGQELWRSDGTRQGTHRVRDVQRGTSGSLPQGLTVLSTPSGQPLLNGTVLFSAEVHPIGRELWRTDGSLEGTALVKDINPGHVPSDPHHFASIEGAGTALFAATQTDFGCEVWITDASAPGTHLLLDIVPGPDSSDPAGFFYSEFLSLVLFSASTPEHGRELWASDGTEAGTRRVADIAPGTASSNPESFVSYAGEVFFAAFSASTGRELWVSDGTSDGTRLLRDITAGVASSMPTAVRVVSGLRGSQAHSESRIVFFAYVDGSTLSSSTAPRLWMSDGTAGGTGPAYEDTAGGVQLSQARWDALSSEHTLVDIDGKVFFAAMSANPDVPRNEGLRSQAAHKLLSPVGSAPQVSVLVEDIDAGPGEMMTIAITCNQGVVSLPQAVTAGLTFEPGHGGGTESVRFMCTVWQCNRGLQGILYTGNAGFNGEDTIVIHVSDNPLGEPPKQARAHLRVHVLPVNDPPRVILPSRELRVLVGDTLSLHGIRVMDIDADEVHGRTVAQPLLAGAYLANVSTAAGFLTLSTTQGVAVLDGTGFQDSHLSLLAPLAQLNAVLSGLRLSCTVDSSCPPGRHLLSVWVSDNGNSGDGGALDASATSEFEVRSS